MKDYNVCNILDEWYSTGNLSLGSPYPASTTDPQDVEELSGGDSGPSGTTNITTNMPAPNDPENIPGPDKKKVVKEAGAEPVNTTTPAPTPQEAPMDPSLMGQDPSLMGQDPSLMGMATPGPTNTFEVGRIYELKKIHSRLVSMQSYLTGTTDPNLIKLRNYVSKSIDLFRTLISNITLYKDRLDEIIIVFYKVVDNVYVILSKYYKDKDSNKMVQAVE